MRYPRILIAPLMPVSILSLLWVQFGDEPNLVRPNEDELILALNDAKRSTDIGIVNSAYYASCRLTWFEEKIWSEEKYCVSKNQVLTQAYSLALDIIKSDEIRVSEHPKFDAIWFPQNIGVSQVLKLEPVELDGVSAYIPPGIDFIERELTDAQQVSDYFVENKFLSGSFSTYCGEPARLNGRGGAFFFVKTRHGDQVRQKIKEFIHYCKKRGD